MQGAWQAACGSAALAGVALSQPTHAQRVLCGISPVEKASGRESMRNDRRQNGFTFRQRKQRAK
jgi:hypothetical protein